MEDETQIVGHFYFMIAVALVIILSLSGCRTEYYENGQIKSEGFSLGTQGLGEYSIITFEVNKDSD